MAIKNKKSERPNTRQAIDGSGKEITWAHPGGKLLRLGPETLSDDELLAVLIGTGTEGRPAIDIAKDVLDKYFSIYGLMGKPSEELLKIKGLKEVKLVRLIAAYELARRLIKHNNNWGDFKPLKSAPRTQPELFQKPQRNLL